MDLPYGPPPIMGEFERLGIDKPLWKITNYMRLAIIAAWSSSEITKEEEVYKGACWGTTVSKGKRCVDCHLDIWILVICDGHSEANPENYRSCKSIEGCQKCST